MNGKLILSTDKRGTRAYDGLFESSPGPVHKLNLMKTYNVLINASNRVQELEHQCKEK